MDKLILVGSVFIGFDFIIKRLSICRLAEDKIDIRINLLNEKIRKLENRIEKRKIKKEELRKNIK